MPLTEDQHTVGEFGSDSADEPFSETVRLRAPGRNPDLWVPNWSSTSCDLGVFVDQSTEPIATSDAKLGRQRRGWKRLERRGLV